MSYLKFDKSQLINLEYSLDKEILRANRAGSYACTSIIGCNTRKYHGLLVSPIDHFDGEKYVLLSSLDETVIQHGKEFRIGIHKYEGDNYEPKGHKYVRDFEAEVIPKITIRVGGVVLRKEKLLVENEEQILIRYTLLEANSETWLKLKPYLAFRNAHQLTKANMSANTRVEYLQNGIRMRLYDGFPFLHMQLSKETEFVHVPDWDYNIEYLKEMERGYDYKEDLFVPGYFEFPIKKGESIIFSASTKKINPKMKFNNSFETASLLSLIFRIQYKAQMIELPRANTTPNLLESSRLSTFPPVTTMMIPKKLINNAAILLNPIFWPNTGMDNNTSAIGHV